MSAYCVAQDLYSYGIARGALTSPARLISSVSAGTDTLALDMHGFADGDPVSFRAETGGSLPAPLVAGTTYYVVSVSDHTFSVALTVGGAALDLTTAGSRVLVIAPLPVAAAIQWASGIIDDMLPAHIVPLTAPYPDIVVSTAAELAASKLLSRTGSASRALGDMVDGAQKRLARWSKGVPIRGTNAPSTSANTAVSSLSLPALDLEGWKRSGGL